jgi:hypothetical protein
MSDIVERLRLLQSGVQWACGARTAATLEEAADEIERLRAERDEAVAALALYRAENGCTRGQRTTQWCGEATRLRAEVDAARREGAAKEREACAKAAETRHEFWHMPHPDDALPFEVCDDVSACADIAAAIRARGDA